MQHVSIVAEESFVWFIAGASKRETIFAVLRRHRDRRERCRVDAWVSVTVCGLLPETQDRTAARSVRLCRLRAACIGPEVPQPRSNIVDSCWRRPDRNRAVATQSVDISGLLNISYSSPTGRKGALSIPV